MGVTLGINDDKWHGIIPAVIMFLALLLLPIWFGHTQGVFLTIVGLGVFSLSWLQLVNENLQFISKDLIKNYKSLKNAQANSKKDWKWFIVGFFAGTFLGFIGFSIVDKL